MSVEYAIVVGFMTLLLAGWVRLLPRLWRHSDSSWEQPHAWWRWGATSWRHFIRGTPSALAFIAALDLLVATGPFVQTKRSSLGFVVPTWYAVTALSILALTAAACVSTIALNWPKWAVPPHMRNQPGALKLPWRPDPR